MNPFFVVLLISMILTYSTQFLKSSVSHITGLKEIPRLYKANRHDSPRKKIPFI